MTILGDFTPPVVGSLWVDDKGLQRLVTDVTGDGRHITWRRPESEKTTRIWWATWRDWARKAVRIDMQDTEFSVMWLEAIGFSVVGVLGIEGHAVINIECPAQHVLTTVGRLRSAMAFAQIPLGPVGADGCVWAEATWDLGGGDGVITVTGLHDGILPSAAEDHDA